MKVAVVLPLEESFSSYYGGAIARWVYETYSLINNVDFLIVGRVDSKNILNIKTSKKKFLLSKVLFSIPYVRRFVYLIFLRQVFSDIESRDIVHIHNAPKYAIYLRTLGYKGNIVLHMHNNYLAYYSQEVIDSLDNNAIHIVVCSQFLANEINKRSETLAANINVIPNGVNPANFSRTKYEVNLLSPLKLLFIGRVVEGKGLYELLLAMELFVKNGPKVQLDIIGSNTFGGMSRGSYHNQCNSVVDRIKQVSPECQINWLGFMSHDKGLGEKISQSDIFICPSICEEAFGMVIIEAMSCGLPVIAFDSGGISEVVNGAGWLVPKGDIKQLSSLLLDIDLNREILVDYSQYSIKRANDYAWSKISKKLYNYLSTL